MNQYDFDNGNFDRRRYARIAWSVSALLIALGLLVPFCGHAQCACDYKDQDLFVYANRRLWAIGTQPWDFEPKVLLVVCDDGYCNSASLHNLGMRPDKFAAVLAAMYGGGIAVDLNNNIYPASNGQIDTTKRLDISLVKSRLMAAMDAARRIKR